MAYPKIEMGLAFLLVTMTWWSVMAQSNDCTNEIISMSPCLSYIQGNSSTPSSGCCSQLSRVVSSQPQCLCQVLNGGGSSLGLTINQTQALQLPKVCNVQTPLVSQCNASPAKSPDGTPGSPSTLPSGQGPNASSADASSMKRAAPFMLFILFMTSSYVSGFISTS